MSYNIHRSVSPKISILSFSSSGAGNVDFALVNGQFSPSGLGTSTIYLDAGFEYFLTSSPVTSVSATGTFYHIVDGVSGTAYSIISQATSSGLDQLVESIKADAQVSFSLSGSVAMSTNSRLEIWRLPL